MLVFVAVRGWGRGGHLGFGAFAPSPSPPAVARAPVGAVFEPEPATTMALRARPLGVTPDGFARWLVRAEFRARDGSPTRLVSGGDFAFVPTHGTAQWQTRSRFGGPAAIVSTTLDGPLGVTARANAPRRLGTRRIETNTRYWSGARVVAEPLGPHVVQIGWFPRGTGTTAVVRIDPDGTRHVANVAASASTFRDGAAVPGTRVRYVVDVETRPRATFAVDVPREIARKPLTALRGKAMWLSFSPADGDADSYDEIDPRGTIDRAVAGGVRAIELRATYGAFDDTAGAPRATIDALLDAAAARGVAVVAWTIPRAPEYDDLALAVALARHTTAAGNGFAGIALDLERGDEYLGSGPVGYAAIAAYAKRLRAALGPEYPLVATVEDPYYEHLSATDYPYAEVARVCDVLQPMAYWRMMSRRAVTPVAVRAGLRASFAKTRALAGRPIEIDIGGQTAGGGPRGAPPPVEIAAAIDEARALHAFGIAFFDWGATTSDQWDAIARTAF